MRADIQPRHPRAPLGVLVELTHEDFDEPFEADAVDVGPGGLGMRAAFLPDVGSKLTCRFDSPSDGRRVEAPCEVVWARDNGPHVGHVGLRFTALDDPAREAIARMLTDAVDEILAEPEPEPPPEPEPVTPARRNVVEPYIDDVSAADDHAQVRLYLDGFDSAIPARVVARHSDGVRVVQKLGLFRLGAGVDVQNGERRRGRIEAVSIRADAAVPELVLDVVYDAVDEAPDTIPDAPAPRVPSGDSERSEPAGEGAAADLVRGGRGSRDPLPERSEGDVEQHDRSVTGRVEVVRPRPPPRIGALDAWKKTSARIRPELERWWAALLLMIARVRPAFSGSWIRVRAAAAHVLPAVARGARRARSFSVHFASALGTRIGSRWPSLSLPRHKRRTTAPPPSRSNVTRRARTAGEPSVRKERARTLLLSLAAFAGAAVLVYALSPTSNDDVDVHRPVPALSHSAASAQPSEEPSGAATSSAAAASGATASTASAAGSAQAAQGAQAAPAAPAAQQPEKVPPASPYAARPDEQPKPSAASSQPSELAQTFGAETVPHARSFLLRMSQPVKGLRGIAQADGFMVTIPGSLSLDRAGPIAAADPAVERSMILNRGDHAELDIRFVDGKSPPYRVIARGRAIEVQIGN